MGRPIINDFAVDTIGHCFICLAKIPPQVLPVKTEPDSSLTHSLHQLSRYLKIKMSKVFHDNETDSIPQHLLDKVQMSALKVSLCEECARWNAKLSQLFQQLEKIEVEAASYLELLQKKALETDENRRSVVFHNFENSNSAEGLTRKLKLEIADTMRKETIQKCVRKLQEVQPQVKIQKLTEKEVRSRTNRRQTWVSHGNNKQHKQHHGKNVEPNSGPEDEVKLEFENETSNGIGNDYTEAFDHSRGHYDDDSESEQSHFPTSTEDLDPGPSIKSTDYLRHIRKSETGRLVCKLCSKDFADHWGLKKHYQSSHLKIRFQCKICSKLFTQEINLKTHQQTVHFKQQRFKCQICNKPFTQKIHLQMHQKRFHEKQQTKRPH